MNGFVKYPPIQLPTRPNGPVLVNTLGVPINKDGEPEPYPDWFDITKHWVNYAGNRLMEHTATVSGSVVTTPFETAWKDEWEPRVVLMEIDGWHLSEADRWIEDPRTTPPGKETYNIWHRCPSQYWRCNVGPVGTLYGRCDMCYEHVPEEILGLWRVLSTERLAQIAKNATVVYPSIYVAKTPADLPPICCKEDFCDCGGATRMGIGPVIP